MSDNFDLKKYLIENKVTRNSRMLNEYFEKESDSLEQAFQKAGIDMSKPITAVKISGHTIDDPMQVNPKSFLKKLEVEKAELEEEEGEAVIYDYDAADSYPAEDMNLPSTMVPKLSVMFSDAYEYVIYQKEGMTETKKKHSKMMNEAETLNLYDMDETALDELYMEYITNNAIDSEKYLVSKGAAPEEAKEIVDEDAVIGGLKGLGVTMTHIATLEVGGTYIDNYNVYDLSDGNVAVEEDYLGMVSIVPMKAFEDFKRSVQGMTETKKKHSKMMKEASDSDSEAIENWYYRTNFYIDDLSPEEIEKGIQDHYEEWTAEKSKYNSIEDYFADVERNRDWY